MARPLRIEYEGALYHVMARGNARAKIFLDDDDRDAFLDNLGRVTGRFDWRVWAWCLMDNHYHLLVETLLPTLSRGMREVNGVYTQAFNRRHGRVGHVLQGRYKAVLVDKDQYLLELSRYVVLNPVQAGLVPSPDDWPWSSYRALMGKTTAPDWLAVDETLGLFHRHRGAARRAYARFVAEGAAFDPIANVQHQSVLGDEAFIERIAEQLDQQTLSREVPRRQRPTKGLPAFEREATTRDDAICAAYASGAFTQKQIGAHFGVHYSVVSRIVRAQHNLGIAKNKT